MNENYCAFDYKAWEKAGLKDYGDFAEKVSYRNQKDLGDCDEGDWFYADDENLTVYWGTFGNYHSPGSWYYADVYDDDAEYAEAVQRLKDQPEWVYGWDDDEYVEYEDGPGEDYQ